MSFIKLSVLALLVALTLKSNAQNGIELGGRSMGMGNVNAALTGNWSLFNNPSGIASQDVAVSLLSAHNRYRISELNSIGAGVILPLNLGTIGISTYRFGDDLFYQQYMNTTYANAFGIGQIGIRINYFEFSIESLGNKSQFTIDLGGMVELGNQLSIGAFVRNIGRSKLSEFEDERLPMLLNVGISHQTTEKLILNADIEKDLDLDPRLKLGLEYQFLPKFAVRSGINTAPFNNFFGLGFKSWKVEIDYAVSIDYVLGTSHQASLTYTLSK